MASDTVNMFDRSTMEANLRAFAADRNLPKNWNQVVERLLAIAGKSRSSDGLITSLCEALGINRKEVGDTGRFKSKSFAASEFLTLMQAIAPSSAVRAAAATWVNSQANLAYETRVKSKPEAPAEEEPDGEE